MKVCNHEGCKFNVFSDGYCKNHQYKSPKFKARQLSKVQKVRIPINRTQVAKKYNTIAKTKKVKSDRNSISGLIKECDYLFSRLIRQLYSDKGISTCYTCNKKSHWKELQAGHYISRGCITLRFSKFNVRVQCKECNEFKGGNLDVFAQNLFKENEIEFFKLIKIQRVVSKVYKSELVNLKSELIKELDENKFEYSKNNFI
jgi:hypothetical protein